MALYIDSAFLDDITNVVRTVPLAGATTNPTILLAALERRIADLRKNPGEILEAVGWSETISYGMENDHE